MKIKSMAVAVCAAAMVVAVSGCGSTSSNHAATSTSSVASPGRTTQPRLPDQPSQETQPGPPAHAEQPAPGAANTPAAEPDTETAAPQPPAPADPVTANPAPNGSGSQRCFDPNSQLAIDSVHRLAAVSTGPWTIESGSDDPIADGCEGTLSLMTVTSGDIHAYQHVLFFNNGTYLGTATAKPHGYTRVVGKTKNTVQVEYKWPNPNDPLCCPQGGPSVVTFTLSGGRVQASGQFPPDN